LPLPKPHPLVNRRLRRRAAREHARRVVGRRLPKWGSAAGPASLGHGFGLDAQAPDGERGVALALTGRVRQHRLVLEMRMECERCRTALQPDGGARICSYECTFCSTCADELSAVCPNCGGELVRRPRRVTG
jgi:uncharacterized protein